MTLLCSSADKGAYVDLGVTPRRGDHVEQHTEAIGKPVRAPS